MHRTRFQKRKKSTENQDGFSLFLFSSLEVSMLDRSKPAQRSLARLTANISGHRGKVIQKLEVSYDFRGIDSSNELLCIKPFQKDYQ
jgi:hypothetical protein